MKRLFIGTSALMERHRSKPPQCVKTTHIGNGNKLDAFLLKQGNFRKVHTYFPTDFKDCKLGMVEYELSELKCDASRLHYSLPSSGIGKCGIRLHGRDVMISAFRQRNGHLAFEATTLASAKDIAVRHQQDRKPSTRKGKKPRSGPALRLKKSKRRAALTRELSRAMESSLV